MVNMVNVTPLVRPRSKNGARHQNLNQKIKSFNFDTIRFVSKNKHIFYYREAETVCPRSGQLVSQGGSSKSFTHLRGVSNNFFCGCPPFIPLFSK